MIQINVLDIEKQKLNAAMAAALKAIRARSYSGRNPELGKMINCPICDLRHRGVICTPVYATGRWDLAPEGEKKLLIASQNTAKGVMGAHTVAKKRLHPHPSKRKLQLVQLTQRLFPLHEPYLTDPIECMKAARNDAYRIIIKGMKMASKLYRGQQKTSRRINAGLVIPGSRFLMPEIRSVSTETKNKRQDKNFMAAERNKKAQEATDAGSQ